MHGGRISRGWYLSKLSWNVIQSDRALLVLPILQCVSMLAAGAALFVPAAHFGIAYDSRLPFLIALIVWAYPATFISTSFGVAFMALAQKKLSGEPVTLRYGFSVARSRLKQIAAWALITTLIGAAIRLLEQVRGGLIAARIAEWLLDATWALATFFVVPILALEGPGPIEATRRSIRVIRQRWGEGVVGTVAIGAAFALLFIPIGILAVIGFSAYHHARTFGIVVFAIVGILAIVVSSAESAVSQLFHLELYAYATTGAPLGTFATDDLADAFDLKRGKDGKDKRSRSPGALDAGAVLERAWTQPEESAIEQRRTELVDQLHRVGLADSAGLLVRPTRMFVDNDGNIGVVLDDRRGERWSGPAAEALKRLRELPTGAGEDRFWPAFRS